MSDERSELLDAVEAVLLAANASDAAAAARAIVDAATSKAHDGQAADVAVAMANEYAAGKPLAYVVGRVRFMDLDLLAAPGALVARPETELLGWTAVGVVRDMQSDAIRLIDMCCGSGNLACGIAARVPTVRVWAADLTPEAVSVAQENARHCGLADRVTVARGDLFAPLAGQGLEGTIDVVVCNPPYISRGRLARDRAVLLEHEPLEAFDGGPYGVSIVQRVIREAPAFLKPGGTLLFEIGVGQQRQVVGLFERSGAYEAPTAVADATGEPRVLLARRTVA